MRKVVLRNAALAALSVSSVLYAEGAQAETSKAYRYEVPVALFNADFQLDSYQVSVILDTAKLISSGKLQADGSDLRVIDAQGRLQPHYIASGLNTSVTQIWIRVHHMPGLTGTDLRILTGNPGVENTSSPSETFDLWDDFEGDTPSGIWQKSCGDTTLTQTGGVAKFAWTNSGMYLATQGGPEGKGKFPSYNNYRVEAKASELVGYYPGFRWVTSDNSGYGLYESNVSTLGATVSAPSDLCGGASSVGTVTAATNSAGVYGAAWHKDGQRAFSPTSTLTATDTRHPRSGDLRLAIGGITTGTGSMSLEWLRVRRYNREEPIVTVQAAVERTLTAPSITGITATETELTVAFAYDDSELAAESFSASCGETSVSGTASPLVVSGLKSGTSYECTVSVTNKLGEVVFSEVQSESTLAGETEPGDGDGDGDSGEGGDGDGDGGGDGDGDNKTPGAGGGDGDSDGEAGDGGKKSSGGCSVPNQGASLSSALLLGLALVFSRRRKPKTT